MSWDQDYKKQEVMGEGIFAIRGNLDGETEEEYTEKEQFIGLKISEEEFYLPIAIVVQKSNLEAVAL